MEDIQLFNTNEIDPEYQSDLYELLAFGKHSKSGII